MKIERYKIINFLINNSLFLKNYFDNLVFRYKQRGESCMAYDVLQIANWFLSKGPMTNKKLQKLCYYSQAWYCTLFPGRKLIDGDFEAWIHGPVHPKLYRWFSAYGWSEIPLQKNIDAVTDSSITEFLDTIFNTFAQYTADQLEAMTHAEKPWKEARQGYNDDEPCENVISIQSMVDFYSKVAENAQLE